MLQHFFLNYTVIPWYLEALFTKSNAALKSTWHCTCLVAFQTKFLFSRSVGIASQRGCSRMGRDFRSPNQSRSPKPKAYRVIRITGWFILIFIDQALPAITAITKATGVKRNQASMATCVNIYYPRKLVEQAKGDMDRQSCGVGWDFNLDQYPNGKMMSAIKFLRF